MITTFKQFYDYMTINSFCLWVSLLIIISLFMFAIWVIYSGIEIYRMIKGNKGTISYFISEFKINELDT